TGMLKAVIIMMIRITISSSSSVTPRRFGAASPPRGRVSVARPLPAHCRPFVRCRLRYRMVRLRSVRGDTMIGDVVAVGSLARRRSAVELGSLRILIDGVRIAVLDVGG